MDVNKFPAGLRVLAIDGDRTTLWVLKRQLQLCNYNYVTMVTEAETALDMLKERKDRDDQFDLVISEVFIPGIDGFKLLEFISLEMDIPVIMLSTNDQMVTMMKGIRHGACDCLVKPARMEQVRNIWMHAVRKSMTDPRNNISDEKEGANSTKMHLKKNKKDGDCDVEEDKETSTQKRPRVLWSAQLHQKFVEAVNEIGFDRAVPKTIQKVMNVPGLSRDKIASHLQKYRIYIRKKNEGTLKRSNPFVDEPQAWKSDRVQSSSSFLGASSSSNTFARMSFPFAFGTHNLLPSQSVQHISSQRNSRFPQQQEMESVGNGLNLPKDVVPVPRQGVSRFISSGMSYGTISSGGFPSSPASSSSVNISNGVVFNTSIPFSSGTSGSSYENISKDSSPSVMSMHFPSSCSRSSYASILRGKILDANKGIPFDADNFFEEIANDEMPAASSYSALQSPKLANQPLVQIQSSSTGLFNQVTPSIHLPFQSSDLVNQPSIQIQCSSAGLNSQVSSESHQFAGLSNYGSNEKVGVLSRFPDIGHNSWMSIGSPQGNSAIINRLARPFPTLGNKYQNQMVGYMGRTTPMVSFSEHVAPFDFGSSAMPIDSSALGSSSRVEPALASLQTDNSVMPTHIPNGEDGTGNLPGGGTVDRQAIGDKMNNNNELPAGISEAPNGTIGNLDDFLADLINQPDFGSGDFF